MTRIKSAAATALLISTATVSAAQTTQGAILEEKGTTVTAFEVPNTTGLAVIDGSTYSYRGSGLTLPNGDVVSVLFDGIGDSKTTESYGDIVTQQVPNPTVHNPLTIVSASTILGASPSGSSATASSENTASSAAAQSGSTASASSSASTTGGVESSNMGTTQSIGGGKVVALVGALAAVVLCGL